MDDEQGDTMDRGNGLLGGYGVLIVPPAAPDGGWLVSVAGWNAEDEQYTASGEGPIFDTGEEAAEEARRVMEWLQSTEDDVDPVRAWNQMQRTRAAAERGDDPPLPWGRF